jgi:hypothetical protein
MSLIAGANSALSAAGTFRITVSEQGGPTPSTSGGGVVDWASQSADITSRSPAGQNQRAIIIGDTFYVRGTLPGLMGSGPAAKAKPWLRVSTNDHAGTTLLTGLMGGLDPFDVMTSLQQSAGPVTTVGHESLAGVAVTHLRTTWAPKSSILTPIRDGRMDVWFDRQGRLRQLLLTGQTAAGAVRMIESLSDFGLTTHIAAPPAAQVADISQVLSEAGSGGGSGPGSGSGTGAIPTPTGQWRLLGQGEQFGVHWQLFETSATRGGWCLATKTTPDLGHIQVAWARDGSNYSGDFPGAAYRGLVANCGPNLDTTSPDGPGGGTLQVLDADSTNQTSSGLHYLAILAQTGVRNLRVNLTGNVTAAASRAGNGFVAIWKGPYVAVSVTGSDSGGAPFQCVGDSPTQTDPPIDVTDIQC